MKQLTKIYPLIKRRNIETNKRYLFYYWFQYDLIVAELDMMIENNISYVDNIYVDPDFRRKGIATILYNTADQFLIKKKLPILSPSKNLTKDGKKFWEYRNKMKGAG